MDRIARLWKSCILGWGMRHWGCRQGRGVSNGTGCSRVSNRQVGSHWASASVPPPAVRLCWEEAGGSTQYLTLRPGSSGLKQVAPRRRCPLKPPAQVSPDPSHVGGRQEGRQGVELGSSGRGLCNHSQKRFLTGPARDHLIPPSPTARWGWGEVGLAWTR